MIAPGPGLCRPRLQENLWQFSPTHGDGALFAANLLRAGIGQPEDWEVSRNIGKFLQATLERFVGDRATEIDDAFDVALSLSTSPTTWRHPEEADPHRILLTFRVAHTVGWINLTPTLTLLEKEHELLPALFYHWLNDSLSRWFRVFDVREAKYCWESWSERREEDEVERREECEREGIPFEPLLTTGEPELPSCIRALPRSSLRDLPAVAKSPKTKRLIDAAFHLYQVSRRHGCPKIDAQAREDLFYDTDPAIPLISLAFGEHDVVTEMLNMELETSGQVEPEPWPILMIDGTDPASIRRAFRCAGCALDTLVAAAQTLSLMPGFEPITRDNP